MRKFCLLAFIAVTLSAQKAPSKQDQQVILDKLDRIISILNAASEPDPPAPTHAKVDIKGVPALGADDAPLTIVEFTDFQCPYCNKFHTETFPKLHDEFIATGKVRFVSMDLPLVMHPKALQAAEAGQCARDQGHFWEMRDWMQSNPTKLDLEDLRGHAIELALDLDHYRLCMETAKYRDSINADAENTMKNLHITGTPTFVIGKSGPVIEGEVMIGAQPSENFEAKLNALLK